MRDAVKARFLDSHNQTIEDVQKQNKYNTGYRETQRGRQTNGQMWNGDTGGRLVRMVVSLERKEGNMRIVKTMMNMTAKKGHWDVQPEGLVAHGRACLEKLR